MISRSGTGQARTAAMTRATVFTSLKQGMMTESNMERERAERLRIGAVPGSVKVLWHQRKWVV